jgi:polyferredoxin
LAGSNYFLVLNSALALGFFGLKTRSYEPWLAGFGLLVSLLWCGVNLGSKFWQSVWENRLSEIEKTIAPKLKPKLFSASKAEYIQDARKSLENSDHKWWIKWIDNLVMLKPSVSTCMIILSVLFVVGWAALFISALVFQRTDPLID